MFSVFLKVEARDALTNLGEKDFNLCNSAICALAVNPYPGTGGDKEKLEGYPNRYRLHISRSYTAIYKIDKTTKRVCVSFFGTINKGHKEY